MAKQFNLVGRLQLQGPYNIKPVVSSIQRQLKGINADIRIKLSKNASTNINNLNRSLDSLNANLTKVSANAKTAEQAITGLAGAFHSFNTNAKANNAALNAVVKNVNKTKTSVKAAGNELENFGKQAGLAVKRFTAFSVATGAIFGFAAAVVNATKESFEFQDELVKLSQVAESSVKGVKELGDEVTRLAVKYGTSNKELLLAAKTLAQAGFSAQETKIALESLAKSSLSPSFDDLTNTTEGLISIFGQFNTELGKAKISVRDFDNILGSVNAVSARFAVEADDIVTAIRGAGAVFAQASEGIDAPVDSLNKLIALFTSVRATTRESAESISTGLRTIFARIQRRSTIDFLKQFGIELTDLEGRFVGPFEAVKRLNEGLASLDPKDVRYSQIAEELGGIRQLSKLLPLIREFPLAIEAYEVAQKGQNSTTEQAIKAQQSLLVQFRQTREQFLALVKDIVNTDAFQSLAKGALSFANTLIKVADAFKGVAPFLAAFLGFKAVKAGGAFLTGFKGAFVSGGGAGGAGSAIGGALTGNGNTAAAAVASQKLASSINDNTFALRQLTVAVQTIANERYGIPYPKGASTPIKFAKGGIVPGSGNRDTVPAVLTPGEYVVRKQAVNAIGAGNLHKMVEGYAVGGEIKQKAIDLYPDVPANTIAKESKRFGSKEGDLFLARIASMSKIRQADAAVQASKEAARAAGNDLIVGSKSLTDPAVGGLFLRPEGNDKDTIRFTKGSTALGFKDEALRNLLVSKGLGEANRLIYPLHGAFIEPTQADKFKKDSDTLLKSAVRTLANKYGAGKQNVKDRDAIIRDSNLQGASGSLFEAFVQSFATKFDKKGGANARWDLPVSSFGSGLENLFGPIPNSIKYLDIKLTATQDSYEDLKDKALSEVASGGLGVYPFPANSKFDPTKMRSISVGKRTKKFAKGGGTTDTVPAMLTPGEYVINRDAARKLGKSTLDRLNNADKVQGFAEGGVVDYLDRKDVTNGKILNPGLSQLVKSGQLGAGKVPSFLNKLARQFGDLNLTGNELTRAMRNAINAIANGASSEEAITKVRNQVKSQLQKAAQGNKNSAVASGLGSSRQALIDAGIVSRDDFKKRDSRTKAAAFFNRIGGELTKQRGVGSVEGELRYQRIRMGAAVIGAGLGGVLQQNAGSATQAATGGAITGIAAGAAAGGAIGGPYGVAIGGLIGGLSAARDSFLEFEKSNALKSLQTSAEQAAEALEQFKAGKISEKDVRAASESVLAARSRAYTLRTREEIFSTRNVLANILDGSMIGLDSNSLGGRDLNRVLQFLGLRDTKEGMAQRNLSLAEEVASNRKIDMSLAAQLAETKLQKDQSLRYLDIRALGTQSLSYNAEVQKAITAEQEKNPNTRLSPEEIENIITSIEVRLGKQVEAQKKREIELSKTMNAVKQNFDMLTTKLVQFGEKLDRTTEGFNKLSIANDVLIAQSQGGYAIGKSSSPNVFSNIGAFSADEIKSAFGSLTSQFGPGIGSLQDDILGIKTLQTNLPKILNSLQAGDPSGSPEMIFRDSLRGISKPIADLIINRFRNEMQERDAGDGALSNFKNDPEAGRKLLLDIQRTLLDPLAELEEKRIEAESRYIDELNKVNSVRQNIEARITETERTRLDVLKRTTEGDLSFDQITAGSRNKFYRLTGGRSIDAAALGAEITAAQARSAEIRASGMLDGSQLEELDMLAQRIQNNSDALNLLKESTDVLAAIENERSKIEKKKEVGRDLANTVFGGGVRGRLDFARQLGALGRFNAGSRRAFTDPSGREFNDLVQALDLTKKALRARGDEAGARKLDEDFNKRLAAEDPSGFLKAMLDSGKEEERLRELSREAGKIQLDAATALENVAKDTLPTVLANANKAFDAFIKTTTALTEEFKKNKTPESAAEKARSEWEKFNSEWEKRQAARDEALKRRTDEAAARARARYEAEYGPLEKKASGGYISGPGGPTADKIPAMLSNGEYVIRAAAVNKIGLGNLEALNRSGKLPGFARGGRMNVYKEAFRRGISVDAVRAGRRDAYANNLGNRAFSFVQKRLVDKNSITADNFTQDPFLRSTFSNVRNVGNLRNKNLKRSRGFANGGLVTNYASGGSVNGAGVAEFQNSVLLLSQAINKLSQISIPSVITMQGTHRVEVVINGAQVLNDLLNGPLSGLVQSEIQKAIAKQIPLRDRLEGIE
jgi:hypothetical protein